MTSRFRISTNLLLASFLVLMLCVVDSAAQTKKKRASRTRKAPVAKPVITNPDIAPPTAEANGDIKIISTADQTLTEGEASSDSVQTKKPAADKSSEDVKQSITNLSNQVNKLTDKLSEMQDDERYQLDMERLTRAEQRAEQVRSQLIDTQSKIADLEAKLEDVEYALKPENIDRVTQGMGTLRPEEVRDSRKRQLENEKSRLQAQLKILENGKNRLEVSSANADAEVDNLRAKLNQRREQMDAAPASSDTRPKKP
jgi:chromosome segregation ATPase